MEEVDKGSRGAAFVIGGSGGLGSAICRRLARDWPAIAFTYRSNRAAANSLAAELATSCETELCQVDLKEEASIVAAVQRTTDRFGKLGTVIFAGGVSIAQPLVADITHVQWMEVFETELIGFTRLVRATLPVFKKQKGGNIVAVVSVANYYYPPGDALSAVPKAGVEVLCRAIAREEGRNGIRANAVAPGIINAGLGTHFLNNLYDASVWEQQRKRVALRRFGEGHEIADAVAFLASEQSSYITGHTIIVDGGLRL